MEQVVSTAVATYKELGALAFLILCQALAFGFMVWRIVKAQDKLAITLDMLFSKTDQMCSILAAHDRQGQDIKVAVDAAGTCLGSIKTTVSEVKGMLTK